MKITSNILCALIRIDDASNGLKSGKGYIACPVCKSTMRYVIKDGNVSAICGKRGCLEFE